MTAICSLLFVNRADHLEGRKCLMLKKISQLDGSIMLQIIVIKSKFKIKILI